MSKKNSEKTTIQINKETREKLAKLKMFPQEPYDNLMKRLMAAYQYYKEKNPY
jgi:hypothetical protein